MATAPFAVALADADGRVVAANASWRRLTDARGANWLDSQAMSAALRLAKGAGGGGEARIGRPSPARWSPPRVAEAGHGFFWLSARDDPRPEPLEHTATLPSVDLPVSIPASPITMAPGDPSIPPASLTDVSARHARLAAVGQLAGGVAHDFNNLLSAIGLRADELLQQHPIGDPAYDNLAQIRATVTRAASLANQLLTFASKATRRRQVIDLADLLDNLEVLLRRLLREDMRLDVNVAADLPLVLADPGQLETVLINLVINARDAIAMAGSNEGCVTITARRVDRYAAQGLGHWEAAGDMALVEVADNGPGIADNLVGEIFDPFFTTKPAGQGTGLGLATVYGIIKQSEGWISVRSAPEAGASFVILLPERRRPLQLELTQSRAREAARPRDLSGAGRILLVEDEDSVRGVAARLLRGRGYEVIEAADGDAALHLAREYAGSIALMISDVVMPGLDGPALLKRARPYLGAIPILFVSGYAASEFSNVLEDEPGVDFLAKPLDFKSLAERVKRALGGPES